MRWILLPVFAVTALAQETGALEGTVTDSLTHAPIRKAQVGLAGGQSPSSSTVTDVNGSFRIAGIRPGQYQIFAGHPAYQMRINGVIQGKLVTVKPGETARISLTLDPGAAISGRVVDEDGDPVAGCAVTVRSSGKAPQTVSFWINQTETRENGEYRLNGIPPGTYYVGAQCGRPAYQPRPFSAAPALPPSVGYALQYYPASTDTKGAEAFSLASGMERSGVDFRLRLVRLVTIKGSVRAPVPQWLARRDLNIILFPARPSDAQLGGAVAANWNRQTNAYRFQPVPVGDYNIVAISYEDKRIGASTPVSAGESSVVETDVELVPAVDASGTIEIEESERKVDPRSVSVQFISEIPGIPSPDAQTKEDGSFTLTGLLPGTWKIQTFTGNGYVKSIWAGNQQLEKGEFHLQPGAAPPPFRLVIGTKMATVRGRVTTAAGEPAPGARIWVLSKDAPTTGARAFAMSGPGGEYNLSSVPPGTWIVAVADTTAMMPPEEGSELTVAEGETAQLDLTLPKDTK